MNIIWACLGRALLLIGGTAGCAVLAAGPANAAPVCDPAAAAGFVAITGQLTDIHISDDCTAVYAVNSERGRIDIYNTQTRTLQTSIPVGTKPQGFDTSPDGKTMYVANQSSRTLSVVDLTAGRELRQVALPASPDYPGEYPYDVAVAANGKVLFGTRSTAFNGDNRLLQYDPVSGVVSARPEVAGNRADLLIKASMDRTVIVSVANAGPGPIPLRYISATDAITKAAPGLEIGQNAIAVNQNGDVFLTSSINNSTDTRINVLTAGLEIAKILRADARAGLGINPDATFAYAMTGQYNFIAVNLATGAQTSLTAGDLGPTHELINLVDVSRDGTLLAFVTRNGISLVNAASGSTGFVHAGAYSSAQGTQSYFRIHNTGSTAGKVHVTLADLTSGAVLVAWDSPIIAAGAASQFAVADIEAAATQPFTRPAMYVATLSPAPSAPISGTFAHIIWNASSGMLSNLTACDADGAAAATVLANVHSSLFGASYASYLTVTNTSAADAPAPKLAVRDARDGTLLGTYAAPPIAAGALKIIAVAEIEAALRLRPSTGMLHYVIGIDSGLTGRLQHLIQNGRLGEVADFTTVCKFH